MTNSKCGICGKPNFIGEMCQKCGEAYHSEPMPEYDSDLRYEDAEEPTL